MKNNPYPNIMLAVLLVAANTAFSAPDEVQLGKNDHFPYARSRANYTADEDFYKVGNFSHLDQILNSRKVKRGADIAPLPVYEHPPAVTYLFKGNTYTIQDFLNHQRITGLMILKDGKVVTEQYQYDRLPEMHMVSFSITKSIISMLIGIALNEKKIASLDDPVEKYVPKLSDTAYAKVTIRNLLRMSSGAKFDQNSSSGVDRDRINRDTFMQKSGGGIGIVSWIKETEAPQGTHFKYSNADTYTLGLVLQAVIGNSISDYTSEKLWQQLGAEDDAAWLLDWSGMEIAHAGFNARLRDFARLGEMLANDGALNGKQIIDKEYLLEATDYHRQPGYLQPFVAERWGGGYCYQFWVWPYKNRTFGMHGAFGQMVIVQPASKIVIVMTSAGKAADESIPERSRFIYGVLKSLGGEVEAIKPPVIVKAESK